MKRLAIVIVSLLAVVASYAQIDAEQVMNIGRNVLSMDDYMLSIQYFNQAIKAKPYLAEPYFYRALAKLELEDYAGAEKDCSLAIERNKYRVESYKLRGFARQNLGKDSLAIEDYDEGLRYNPHDKYFLYYKSVAQTELKRYAEADSTFSLLLRQYPKFDEGYTARGRLRALEGDTVSALADLTKAIELSHTSIRPWLMRCDIEMRRRNWESAARDLDEAISLEPRDANLYLNRAFIRYNLDDYFGAMADYNYTLELQPFHAGALFNRALLRYEVKDLNRAAEDLASVLKLEPDNFHARYNLGLIDLERGHYKEALQSFDVISKKYPRFYPVYYAKAEALQRSGNMRAAMQNVYQGDNLVKGYVKNPERNPLDRPTIQAGAANDVADNHANESEEEVMARFNQLVTVGAGSETPLAYNDKIKGRVQDRDIQIETLPSYLISFLQSEMSLKSTSNYFRELDDYNQRGYSKSKIYLTPESSYSSEAYDPVFALADAYAVATAESDATAADWFSLGVARVSLKDYENAAKALTKTIEMLPDFSPAYLERGFARQMSGDERMYQLAISDYDAALRLNPRLVYALYNKGNIYYNLGQFTSALDCYSSALRIDPDFGDALYNRGITYLRMGNKRAAFADLSRAGELGVIPSYNLLKRMK